MKTTKEKAIRIVYYDKDGAHETKHCKSLYLSRMNYSVPSNEPPTLTYTLFFENDGIESMEDVTVPFVHSIEPV